MIVNNQNKVLNYDNYKRKIEELFPKGESSREDCKIDQIGNSRHGYPIHMISIGRGSKDIFVVCGISGNDIMSADFGTDLIKELLNAKDFNPELCTIKIIPILNPEGFDIVTSSFNNYVSQTHDSFTTCATEYQIRYALDRFMEIAASSIHNKNFVNLYDIFNSKDWKKIEDMLGQKKGEFLKIIAYFIEEFNKLEKKDFDNFSLLCQRMGNQIYMDPYFPTMMNLFSSPQNLHNSKFLKLHQGMFKDSVAIGLYSSEMETAINLKYVLDPGIPRGSIITHEGNGRFVNLNKNAPNNSELYLTRDVYGEIPTSNILKNHPGPLGLSCTHSDVFSFEPENQALIRELNKSIKDGRYATTLFYDETGGEINSVSKNGRFNEYNKTLANAYNYILPHQSLEYKQISTSEYETFADYISRHYPGVLKIKLSNNGNNVGRNSICLYGNPNNVERVKSANFAAVLELAAKAAEEKCPYVKYQIPIGLGGTIRRRVR